MKKLLTILLALGFSAAALAATKTVTLSVKGWTCGSCAAATRIALRKLEGVEEVKTDLEKEEAVVTYDDAKVTPEKMIRAVEKLGYKASVREGAPGSSSAEAKPPSIRQETASPVGRHVTARKAIPPDRITLFEAPLGCWAVEGLGCGGHSKPILLELERDPKIAEAWLNHPGTLLAVVWKEPKDSRSAIAEIETAFHKRGLDVMTLQGPDRERSLKEFQSDSSWYRGAEVDRLSEREAEVLASRLVGRVEKRVALPPERAAALRNDVTARLRQWMLGERPAGKETLRMQELLDVARKYLDTDQIAEFEKALALGIRRLPEDAS